MPAGRPSLAPAIGNLGSHMFPLPACLPAGRPSRLRPPIWARTLSTPRGGMRCVGRRLHAAWCAARAVCGAALVHHCCPRCCWERKHACVHTHTRSGGRAAPGAGQRLRPGPAARLLAAPQGPLDLRGELGPAAAAGPAGHLQVGLCDLFRGLVGCRAAAHSRLATARLAAAAGCCVLQGGGDRGSLRACACARAFLCLRGSLWAMTPFIDGSQLLVTNHSQRAVTPARPQVRGRPGPVGGVPPSG